MIVSLEKPGTPHELVHYGIKGMRWGVRKAEETSPREEPAAPKEKFTQRHKKALIGAGVVVGLLATYGAFKFVDSGEAHVFMLKGKQFVDSQAMTLKKDDRLASKMDVDGIMKNVVRQVNPDFGKIGTKNNCRRCTFAYEMRRRGYDVCATRSIHGTGQTPKGEQLMLRPGAKRQSLGSIWLEATKQAQKGNDNFLDEVYGKPMGDVLVGDKDFDKLHYLTKGRLIMEALGRHPEGARGELNIKWAMGGKHSLAWEIVGGKPVIFDTQTGEFYTTIDKFLRIAHDASAAGFTRLDNRPLNARYLRDWVQNAK